MKIVVKKYNDWKIYSPEGNIKLGELILNKNFEILKILKDTKRNYVALILIENNKYILKSFRSEVIIPQRRVQTFFKKGEALTTLENGLNAIEKGITELVKPLVAIVKKNIFIEESFLLMEYVAGRNIETKDDIDQIIKVIKKIHKLKMYHGDLNTSNFLINKKEVKILDTQMKKESLLFFKRAYDLLTLEEDLLVIKLGYSIQEEYNYRYKSIGYFLAKVIKNFKKLKIVKVIKKQKKKLREKGWRI